MKTEELKEAGIAQKELAKSAIQYGRAQATSSKCRRNCCYREILRKVYEKPKIW